MNLRKRIRDARGAVISMKGLTALLIILTAACLLTSVMLAVRSLAAGPPRPSVTPGKVALKILIEDRGSWSDPPTINWSFDRIDDDVQTALDVTFLGGTHRKLYIATTRDLVAPLQSCRMTVLDHVDGLSAVTSDSDDTIYGEIAVHGNNFHCSMPDGLLSYSDGRTVSITVPESSAMWSAESAPLWVNKGIDRGTYHTPTLEARVKGVDRSWELAYSTNADSFFDDDYWWTVHCSAFHSGSSSRDSTDVQGCRLETSQLMMESKSMLDVSWSNVRPYLAALLLGASFVLALSSIWMATLRDLWFGTKELDRGGPGRIESDEAEAAVAPDGESPEDGPAQPHSL